MAATADAEHVCYNAMSMLEGLRVLSQPPWYVGYNNTTVPPDSSYVMAANRYGYRGSNAIQQHNVKPYEMPARTTTVHTPAFLSRNDDYVDEYVPPIVAAKQQSVNGLETPKLWPENTSYVEGFRKKQRPSSWLYKRETTVDQPMRPKSPQSLSAVMQKATQETQKLRDYALMETQRTILSHSGTAQRKFEAAWSDQLLANATTTLKHSLQDVHPPYEAHTLLDPSDAMRYSGSTAMIVHSQTTDELKFRLRLERSRSKANMPFEMKWQHVMAHFNNVKHKLKRNQAMSEVVDKIARFWQQVALKAGSETSLHRADFVQACGRISFFEDVSGKQMSQLYSLFDPAKKNSMRFVEILLMFVVLDNPEENIFQKVRALWQCSTQFGLDRSLFDVALEVLSSCAGNRADLLAIESYFRSEFKPRCYEYSITGKVDKVNWAELIVPGKATAETGLPASKSTATSFVKHQYNICESQLNGDTLEEVLQACPMLLKELDSQLSARLLACYGRDDRNKEPEQPSAPVENLDFSWIMKKEAPQREVFGLY